MSLLIAFHRFAAARGDGLEPRLLAFLEERAAAIEANPQVVEFTPSSGFVQAGPCPRPEIPEFLPGNVVGFTQKQAVTRQGRRKSSATHP